MELSVTNLLMEDHDALTGSGVTAIDKNNAVPEKKNRLIGRSRKTDTSCCGRKCLVATVVGMFLFVTFVSLPAGIFLIIHGKRQNSWAFKLGGAIAVSVPVLVAMILCLIICLRRTPSTGSMLSIHAAYT